SGAYVTTGGVWTNASSREYKENIQTLTSREANQTLDGLNPVRFSYKADKEDRHVGFIAEDVPDLVATQDRKGLSPMDIVAVLTKVIQEQKNAISELSQKVDIMQQEMNKAKGLN
ncbi:MAG: tail fiber domain-containing protein, partial [Syntrophales bacterium]